MRRSHRKTLVLSSVAVLCLAGCAVPTEQPLAFNHKAHAEADITCGTCHEHFETSESSGIPGAETCTLCHEGDSEVPALQKLAHYVSANEEIPWQRIYGVPSHVYYSHRRHVVSAQIPCAECHGNIGELPEPPKYALVNQTMEWCMDCHTQRGASTECIHCHR